ncbi:Rrf2 family transcriptional regulator [uncultured Maricaulis sp.]|uniref:Rrf2 family transcriptional regulator n=1 Tax=uncultured Maricaulis sp. TaxID=174710 RepID=UPI00263A2115|nr:Rrf2 family transcriptional regulator [uncultured Maricaulis sp.]
MKLSTKGRYAVMAMADLADAAETGPVTLSDIASRQSISLSYLEQLFAKLRRADIVSSVRGPGGGYKLSRLPTQIRISDIILAVDEPLRATRCSEAKGCLSDGRRCITHDLWDELGRHIYLFLSSITLEDVLERRLFGAASGAVGRIERPAGAPRERLGAGDIHAAE